MKKLFSSLLLLAGLFVVAPAVRANEGRIVLENKGVRCEGISVWRDGQYKVMGKCYGLQYPYRGEYDRYYLWVEDAKKDVDVRVVEINRGFFEGFVYNNFGKVFVTAEKTSSPRKPSKFVIMSGSLQAFKMPEGRQEIKAVSTTTPKATTTVQNKTSETQSSTQTQNSSVAKVFGRIVLSILIIIFIVIVMVIVGSLIFRKRGSVS